jgi:hypothetical protein
LVKEELVMQSITFTDVHIIQWLKCSDTKIGRELFDSIQTIPNEQQPLIHFADMNNKQDVLKYLEQLLDLCKESGSIPLIHFVTHGNTDGIGTSLMPDQYLTFDELTVTIPHSIDQFVMVNSL